MRNKLPTIQRPSKKFYFKILFVLFFIFLVATWIKMFNDLYYVISPIQKKAPIEKKAIKPSAGIQKAYAVEVTTPSPTPTPKYNEEYFKQFIYFSESGNHPCKINGGAIDCNYNGDRACGIGQSLPCQKLLSECPDLSDYACQDRWFTNYMLNRYGSWENAYNFWQENRWW